MKKFNFLIAVALSFYFLFAKPLLAQEEAPAEAVKEEAKEEAGAGSEVITVAENVGGKEGTVTVDFNNADIRNVLRVLSYKGGVNIIAAEEVKGTVTSRLVDVPWETALNVILKTYGFAYEKSENIIRVTTIERLRSEKEAVRALSDADKQQMAVVNKVFELKYVDANDIKVALDKQLSPQGSITVFQKTTRAGWQLMGLTGGTQAATREGTTIKEEKSKVLIVSDIPPIVEKIAKLIEELDILPKQILVEALIVEVNADDESKLGIKWTATATLTGSKVPTTFPFIKSEGTRGKFSPTINPANRGVASDSAFPTATATNPLANPGYEEFFPYTSSTAFTIGSLSFTAFQAVLEAMATDVHTNLLSNPKILTLDNQEASILVGERYPLLTSETTDQGTLRESLDHYEAIGIQLLVVPQIWEGDRVNMIIHPAVTSLGGTVTGSTGFTAPRITTREADTQVVIKDGETLVLGGLVKDEKKDTVYKVPILGDIPLLGLLFRHKKTEVDKIELLVFVTPRIVKEGQVLANYEKEKLGTVSKKLPEKK